MLVNVHLTFTWNGWSSWSYLWTI